MKKIVFLSICAIVFAGCDDTKIPSRSGGGSPVAESLTGMDAAQELHGDRAQAPEAEEPQPETEVVKADVGAGKKGHYGQKGGEDPSDIITVPVATLFRAKEMIAYRNQIPHAMQLYKAMNDGKGPPDHETFMKDVVQANNIPLPELPEGHKYLYDPKTEELMIEKPK